MIIDHKILDLKGALGLITGPIELVAYEYGLFGVGVFFIGIFPWQIERKQKARENVNLRVRKI